MPIITALALVALPIAVVALVLAVLAWSTLRGRGAKSSPLPTDLAGLRASVEALRAEVGAGLRHQAVVRYDAFGDMGGRLSWSLALLDAAGNGVVITSIHGRSDARTYAKNISGWAGEQQLSVEEVEAVELAKAG